MQRAHRHVTCEQSPRVSSVSPPVTTQVAQVSDPPAAPKGMSIPPPPPPEPPRMEVKAEAAAKPAKPKEEAKAAAKPAEPAKAATAKDTLSKLFRSKVNTSSEVEPACVSWVVTEPRAVCDVRCCSARRRPEGPAAPGLQQRYGSYRQTSSLTGSNWH